MQAIQLFEKDPWIENKDKIPSKWSFDTSGIGTCKLFTYKDLWNNNYYITEGSKFGGHFLVYLGDPVNYHAKYIVVCIESPKEIKVNKRIQDLVARSRYRNMSSKAFD